MSNPRTPAKRQPQQPRTGPLVIGLALWALCVLLPLIFVSSERWGWAEIVFNGWSLLAAPALLLIGLARQNDPLVFLGFPLSMVPALLYEPATTGPRVYSEWPMLAVVATATAFVASASAWRAGVPLPKALRMLVRRGLSTRKGRLVTIHVVLSIGVLSCFVGTALFSPGIRGAFRTHYANSAPTAQLIAISLGALVWWLVLTRLQVPLLSLLVSDWSTCRDESLKPITSPLPGDTRATQPLPRQALEAPENDEQLQEYVHQSYSRVRWSLIVASLLGLAYLVLRI